MPAWLPSSACCKARSKKHHGGLQGFRLSFVLLLTSQDQRDLHVLLQVPIMLYKEAMQGVRKHLIRHMYDGTAHMSFVSEATANQATGQVSATNDRFEHLTCFAGGMFILGEEGDRLGKRQPCGLCM